MRTDAELGDEILMRRFGRTLDERHLLPILDRYHAPALRIALRYVGNRADAEDVVQDAFVRLVRRHRNFRADKPFAPWFYTILRHVALDHLRARTTRPLARGEPLSEDIAARPEPIEPLEDRRWLSFLAPVAPRDRELLLYRYRHGMTFPEITEVTGEPIEALKKRAQRALGKLRECFVSRNDALDRILG